MIDNIALYTVGRVPEDFLELALYKTNEILDRIKKVDAPYIRCSVYNDRGLVSMVGGKYDLQSFDDLVMLEKRLETLHSEFGANVEGHVWVFGTDKMVEYNAYLSKHPSIVKILGSKSLCDEPCEHRHVGREVVLLTDRNILRSVFFNFPLEFDLECLSDLTRLVRDTQLKEWPYVCNVIKKEISSSA